MIMIIFKNRFLMKEEIYEKIHSSNKKKYDVKTIIININNVQKIQILKILVIIYSIILNTKKWT